jgi:hypothetical protein
MTRHAGLANILTMCRAAPCDGVREWMRRAAHGFQCLSHTFMRRWWNEDFACSCQNSTDNAMPSHSVSEGSGKYGGADGGGGERGG